MQKRVYSLETEYALVHDSSAAPLAGDRLYDLLETHLLASGFHAVCDPTRRFHHSPSASLVQIKEGYFLENGARFYMDTGHLEWAAPESQDPYQALVHDQAGDAELTAAARAIQPKLVDGRALIVKNNIDYQTGVTYGCHENYSIRRRSDKGKDVLKEIVGRLAPFLVTRQAICGAGRLGSERKPYVAFQISQRADFTTALSSVNTRDNRPIVNLRDEALGDERVSARLHLILGDSNMAEYSSFLKLGTMGLLLDMIEADAPLPDLRMDSPQQNLSVISRDLEFRQRIRMQNGGSMTSLDIQRAYWKAAREFVVRQQAEDEESNLVIELWDEMLTALSRRDSSVEYCLDWAIKHRMLTEILERSHVDWDEMNAWEPVIALTWGSPLPGSHMLFSRWGSWRQHLPPQTWSEIDRHMRSNRLDWNRYLVIRRTAAALRAADIRYHDIDPEHGLFHRWVQAERLSEEAEIQYARQHAPDTRAAVRSYAIRQAINHKKQIAMDWDIVRIGDTEIPLPDPLSTDLSKIDRLFGSERKPEKPVVPPPSHDIEINILGTEKYTDSEE